MGDFGKDGEERKRQIANLLLVNRAGGTDWGEFQTESEPWSKRLANRFLVGCLLDYQIDSALAWRNADRLVKEILADPEDLWLTITSVSESEWELKHGDYHLHRFPVAHNRLWLIGKCICDEYGGDARSIWEGKSFPAVLEALWSLGAGEQISRMIVGALRDCGQIQSGRSDVKGDSYVRRVLGRAVFGETTDPETAVRLSREMNPADPWQLDAQLWVVGKSWCRATDPDCPKCYLAPHCEYALTRQETRS